MTAAEALDYVRRGLYRNLADGTPWPYIVAILGDPAHPMHAETIARVDRHHEEALRVYRSARKEQALLAERYANDPAVLDYLQRQVDGARSRI